MLLVVLEISKQVRGLQTTGTHSLLRKTRELSSSLKQSLWLAWHYLYGGKEIKAETTQREVHSYCPQSVLSHLDWGSGSPCLHPVSTGRWLRWEP